MWKRIESEGAPLLVFLSVVVILLIAAVAAYFLLSSKRTRKPTRRVASWAAAAVSTVVALFATMHFGIPVLEDFENPDVAVRDTLIGTAIVWAICISLG